MENIAIIEIINYLEQHGLTKLAEEEKYMLLHCEKNAWTICYTGPPIFINYKRFTEEKKELKKQKKYDRRDIYIEIVRSL